MGITHTARAADAGHRLTWLSPETIAAVHADTARRARALLRELRLCGHNHLPVVFAAPSGRMFTIAMPVAEMMDRLEQEVAQAEIGAHPGSQVENLDPFVEPAPPGAKPPREG
jgi:hypothetical protein